MLCCHCSCTNFSKAKSSSSVLRNEKVDSRNHWKSRLTVDDSKIQWGGAFANQSGGDLGNKLSRSHYSATTDKVCSVSMLRSEVYNMICI